MDNWAMVNDKLSDVLVIQMIGMRASARLVTEGTEQMEGIGDT